MNKENMEPIKNKIKERSLTPPKASLKKFFPEMDKLKQEINDLKNKNQDLENYKILMEEYNEIKPIGRDDSVVINYDKEIQQLQQDIIDRETIMQDLNDANNEIYHLQQIIIKHEKDIKERSRKIENSDKKCKDLKIQIKSLNIEIDKIRINRDSIQSRFRSNKTELMQKNKLCKELQFEIKSLNEQLLTYKIQIQSNTKQYDQSSKLQQEITKKDEQIIEYKQQIDKLWDELNNEDIQYLYFQISELKKQLNESNKKLISTEKNLETTKNKCRKIEIERDQMHTTIIKVRDENEHNINNLRREIQILKEKNKYKNNKCLFF